LPIPCHPASYVRRTCLYVNTLWSVTFVGSELHSFVLRATVIRFSYWYRGESSRERKFQEAKVPPMVLSLLGAKVRGNESSIIRKKHRQYESNKVNNTATKHSLCPGNGVCLLYFAPPRPSPSSLLLSSSKAGEVLCLTPSNWGHGAAEIPSTYSYSCPALISAAPMWSRSGVGTIV